MVSKTGGVLDSRNPKSCNQVPNRGVRFPWKRTPEGRIALCVILLSVCSLRRSDGTYYENQQMAMGASRNRFPSGRELYVLFLRILPWFPKFYNDYRRCKYDPNKHNDPDEKPFGYHSVFNRIHYMFTEPGNSMGAIRVYGIGKEHPESTSQADKPLGKIWGRESTYLDEKVANRVAISQLTARLKGTL